jgi:hypothetical protein
LNSILSFLRAPIQKTWHYWLYAFGIVYLTFPFLRLFEEPSSGLDPSWQIALNLLRSQDGIWGKDFVFTYGPLGSYIYRLPIHVPAWKQFIYDGFFFGNLLYFHASCFPKQAKNYHLPLFFIFNIFSFEMIGESTAFLWMFLGMYHGFVALHAQNKIKQTISLCFSFVLLGIIFYTKANYGIFVWAFLITLLVVMVIQKNLSWWLGFIYLLFFAGTLWVWAAYLHTDLPAYFKTSLHIIANYNAGMSVFPIGFKKLTALTYLVFGVQVVFTFYHIFVKERQDFSAYLLLAFSLGISFVLLKYSFLRADSGHLTAYVKLLTYVGILLISYSSLQVIRRFYLFLLPCVFVLYVWAYVPLVGFTPLGIWHGIKYRHNILNHYFSGGQKGTNKPIGKRLPQAFLDSIKNRSVDIIPYEISWVYFNNLNYRPRPTLQSYMGGDNYLDSLNENYLASRRAPEYIIYSLEKSTLKYPWMEESLTQKALFTQYKVLLSNDSLLLFERKPQHRKLSLVFTRQEFHKLGEEIKFGKLQSGYLRESSIETAYSSSGVLANLFFQPPQLVADFKSGNAHERVRVTPNLLKKGFWSNQLVLNLDQALRFYEQKSDSTNELQSIKIVENNYFKGGFQSKIRVTHRFYRIE